MRKIKHFLVNAALFCGVCVLLAGGAEAVLRVTGTKPPAYVTPEAYGNVNLLYRPNSVTRWRGNLGRVLEFDTPIRTNALTQFDYDRDPVKPGNVYRVILVGDSYIEALQVPLENGMPGLLEDALNRDPDIAGTGKRVEVMKLGGSGNGALKAYELLKLHGLEYRPDLVIAFLTDSNDLNDDWHYFRRSTGLEKYQHVNLKPSSAVYDKLAFYDRLVVLPWSWLNRWAAFAATQWRDRGRQEEQDAAGWKDALGPYALPGAGRFKAEADKWNEALRLTSAAHMKMRADSAAAGAEYAAAFIDRQQTYRPDAYRYLYKVLPGLEKEVDLDLPAKKLKRFFDGNQVPWIDLNDIFKERSAHRRTGHYARDGHWNAEGHRWAAEALTPFVKERLLNEFKKN
jgi:lysophospholipase L1-like esterase